MMAGKPGIWRGSVCPLARPRWPLMFLAVLVFLIAGCGSGSDEKDARIGNRSARGDDAAAGARRAGETDAQKEKDAEAAAANGGKDCDSVGDLDAKPDNSRRATCRCLDGATSTTHMGPFGKTEQFFAAVDGDAEDLPQKRDAVVDQLVADRLQVARDRPGGRHRGRGAPVRASTRRHPGRSPVQREAPHPLHRRMR